MAGYGWSSRHGNIHDRPQRPSHIACRICDRVFMNAPALIDHIESHMAGDPVRTATTRNLLNLMPGQPLRGSLLNPFQLSLSPPHSAPVNRPYSFKCFQNRNRFNLALKPTSFVRKRPVSFGRAPFYLMGKKFMARGPHGAYIVEDEECGEMKTRCEDCTRPFLQLLEKPIAYASVGDDKDQNSADLDLSLKL